MSVKAADVIAYAKTQLGKPYVWGASGPNSFDCSSLMQYTYRHFGISIPRVTYDQVKIGQPVAKGAQQPGDLIFSDWGSGRSPGHVAMYIGNGQVIEAPDENQNVKITPYNSTYQQHTTAIRRVIDAAGNPLDLNGVSTTPVSLPAGGGGSGGTIRRNPLEMARDAFGRIIDDFTPDNPLEGIRHSIAGIGQSISVVGNLAEWGLKLTYPTTLIRAVAAVFGTVFFFLGLLVLMKEVRDA